MSSHVKPRLVLSTRDADLLRLQYMAARYKARVGERIRDARLAKGERIREAGEGTGLTQAQLARMLPGSTEGSQVSRWERGEVQPQPDTLDALAAALDVDVSYFLAPAPESGTPDLMDSLNEPTQLDRIELLLKQLESRQTATEAALTELVAAVASRRESTRRRKAA